MTDQVLLIAVGVTIVTLILLIQIYLSSRPRIIWGFVMPFIFLVVWLYVVLDMGEIIIDITANQLGSNYISWLGVMGMLVSLLILLLCRKRVIRKADIKNNRRIEALFAKQQRQAAIAAISEDHDANKYFAAAEYQRMLQEKAAALKLSNQRLQEIEEKQQAKIKHRKNESEKDISENIKKSE